MKIRLASQPTVDSIVDGPGIRTTIWTQGCPHKCLGCHNPSTHDMTSGFDEEIENIKKQLSETKGQTGITLSGGEPMVQPEACLEIAKHARTLGLDVWCYTGYTYEQLILLSEKRPVYLELLNNIDVLVDGKFVIELKSYNLKFRGSSNQRIIDVKKSLEEGQVILLDEYNEIDKAQDLYEKPAYVFV